MEVPLDLNREMILMRKEIKRAKARAVSKLVRHIRNLRHKKGNDVQVAKNAKRAERLIEEIESIKDLKPDLVFKALLHCNVRFQDLAKPDIRMDQRALVRIGSASFIQKRMQEIKNNVSAFQSVHSNNDTISFDKFSDAIPLSDARKWKSDPKSVKKSSDIPIDTLETHESEDSDELIHQRNNKDIPQVDRLELKTPDTASRDDPNDATLPPIVLLSEEKAEPEHEGEQQTEYEVALPTSLAVKQERICKRLNLLAETEGAECVTDILPNIGENFKSDGEDTDIELEDLAECMSRKDQKTNVPDKLEKGDVFFIDREGAREVNFPRARIKETKFIEASDEESLKQVKSCFVESLAEVSHQRAKSKNRMSQRARKKQASKGSQCKNHGKESPAKTLEKLTRKTSNSLPTNNALKLHPSWEASKKRKQEQSTVRQFQGKRVCFEDSE